MTKWQETLSCIILTRVESPKSADATAAWLIKGTLWELFGNGYLRQGSQVPRGTWFAFRPGNRRVCALSRPGPAQPVFLSSLQARNGVLCFPFGSFQNGEGGGGVFNSQSPQWSITTAAGAHWSGRDHHTSLLPFRRCVILNKTSSYLLAEDQCYLIPTTTATTTTTTTTPELLLLLVDESISQPVSSLVWVPRSCKQLEGSA